MLVPAEKQIISFLTVHYKLFERDRSLDSEDLHTLVNLEVQFN